MSWSETKSAFPGGSGLCGAVGSGKGMGGSSFVRLVFIWRSGPAVERPFTARICVRARARVGAGAVRAPDCPRARQPQGAPLPPRSPFDKLRTGSSWGAGMKGRGPGRGKGSGTAGTSPEMSCFVMFAMPSAMLCRSVPAYRSSTASRPPRFRPPRRRPGGRDPLPRAFACGRGRALAPARFARLIARTRGKHRTHLTCRLNRGRSAPGRHGRDAVHGCRFPRTHHSTNH